MALIDDKHKFIFFHLFKCGGNSVRKIITFDGHREGGGAHANVKDIKKMLYVHGQKEKFDNYFKFAIIRNPFDWMVSTYYYIRFIKGNRFNEAVTLLPNFQAFIPYYVNVMMKEEGVPLGGNKCETPLQFISDDDGTVLVDHIGKMEEIDKEMAHIQKQIGLKQQGVPVVNVSPHKGKDYKKYYNAESIALIRKYFAEDLEYLEYDF